MKASEYVEQLTQLIAEHGDKDVYILGSYSYQKPLGPHYVKEGHKESEFRFLHEPDDYIKIS